MFSQVSVCPWRGGYLWTRVLSRGGYLWYNPGGDLVRRVLTPPPAGHGNWDTMGYSRQTGGRHPTVMLSCNSFILFFKLH